MSSIRLASAPPLPLQMSSTLGDAWHLRPLFSRADFRPLPSPSLTIGVAGSSFSLARYRGDVPSHGVATNGEANV